MLQTKLLQYTDDDIDKELLLSWDENSINLKLYKRAVGLELLKTDIDSLVNLGAVVYSLEQAGIPVRYYIKKGIVNELNKKLVPEHNIVFSKLEVLYSNNQWSAGDMVLHTKSTTPYTYAQLLNDLMEYVVVKSAKFAPKYLH